MNAICTRLSKLTWLTVLSVGLLSAGTLPAADGNDPWSQYRRPGTTQPAPTTPDVQTPAEDDLAARISRRYRSADYQRFVQSLSERSAFSLYQEATHMIDTRHIQPGDDQQRLNAGIDSLLTALENNEFRSMFRVSASRQAVNDFRQMLTKTRDDYPVTNRQQSQQFTQWTASQAQARLGLNPVAVYLEFTEGAVSSLDQYSSIVPLDRTGQLDVMKENVVGIGVEIKEQEQGITIQKVLAGGPAADAGLQKGDVITGIEGRTTSGMSLDELVGYIAGPVGTPVRLELTREGRRGRVTLYRRQVEIRSVSDVQMIDDETKTAYLALDHFGSKTAAELDEALWSLHNQGMQTLVMDLRGNPGGLLTTAIEVADRFLPSGTIVSTKGRTASDNMVEKARFEQTWRVPLVVLIDENSASASEIFAAAIQENERGLIVGRKSYGKGTVQTHFPLQSVSATLKLTTAHFYSPNNRMMAGSGVTPDVAITANNSNSLLGDADIAAAIWLTKGGQVQELADRARERQNFAG